MVVSVMTMLVGALFFAGAVYLGMALGNLFADRVTGFTDGPAPHAVPATVLLVAGALIGGFVTTHAIGAVQILIIAIVCMSLAAVWVTDARRGIVPDVFTLVPIVIILANALWHHEWGPFIAVALPTAPFAFAAILSKGRGMGWGDVKLVALGGALLGVWLGIVALIVACLAAVIVNYTHGRKRGIIAFAPYLAACIALAVPIGLLR